jgi:hypothetical protein
VLHYKDLGKNQAAITLFGDDRACLISRFSRSVYLTPTAFDYFGESVVELLVLAVTAID